MLSHPITLLVIGALSGLIPTARAQIQCPGVLQSNGDDSDQICCVGGTLPDVQVSNCPGWPFCTGPATTTQESDPPLSCAEVIPITASDYSEKISTASASLEASGTNYQTTLADGPATAAPSATSAVASATRGGSSSAGSADASATASSTQDGSNSVTSARSSATASPSTDAGILNSNPKIEAIGGVALLLAFAV